MYAYLSFLFLNQSVSSIDYDVVPGRYRVRSDFLSFVFQKTKWMLEYLSPVAVCDVLEMSALKRFAVGQYYLTAYCGNYSGFDDRFEQRYEIDENGLLYHRVDGTVVKRVKMGLKAIAVTNETHHTSKVMLEDGSEWVLFHLVDRDYPAHEPQELKERFRLNDYTGPNSHIVRGYLLVRGEV